MKTKISDFLEIPSTTLFKDTRIEIQSNHEILIEGYNTILEYNNLKIKISAFNFSITVNGENLSIYFMDKNSLIIKGVIKQLEF